jgi:SAM-dependent methyltransferase
MLPSTPTPYDDVFYPGHVYGHTHPNRLATIASLYGMAPVPVARCRVLELGCGVGGNLVPMAFQNPRSEFVGIDLSGATIERGQRNVEALGLSNIKLLNCDIMDFDAALGQFDYIIAHGVYSWVPPLVRGKMMEIFKKNLSADGICYVSYNAHPFSHLRDLARDMMLYHTRDIRDVKQKTAQARAIMKFLSEGSKADTVHGAVMRAQFDRVIKMPEEVLFHDDLNATAEAFLLHRVVEEAGKNGLQYLSDAEFTLYDLARYTPDVRATLEKFPDSEFMSCDQYKDFLDGHGFRRTLLCHDNVVLRRTIPLDFITRFYLLCSAEAVDPNVCLTDSSPMAFTTQESATFTVAKPLLKAAHVYFGSSWPRAVSFEELFDGARALLGRQANVESAGDDKKLLIEALYVLAYSGEVSFRIWPPFDSSATGGRPRASWLARKQAESGTLVTNLLHESVRLNDDKTRYFLRLLDGTRTVEEITAEMRKMAAVETGDQAPTESESGGERTLPIREFIDMQLKIIDRLALLL